jgi:hypothetical protein
VARSHLREALRRGIARGGEREMAGVPNHPQRLLVHLPELQSPLVLQPQTLPWHLVPKDELSQSPSAMHPHVPALVHWLPFAECEQSMQLPGVPQLVGDP